MIGADIGKPNTVVDMSILLTSTRILGLKLTSQEKLFKMVSFSANKNDMCNT